LFSCFPRSFSSLPSGLRGVLFVSETLPRRSLRLPAASPNSH
jgi:hypothetical protein